MGTICGIETRSAVANIFKNSRKKGTRDNTRKGCLRVDSFASELLALKTAAQPAPSAFGRRKILRRTRQHQLKLKKVSALPLSMAVNQHRFLICDMLAVSSKLSIKKILLRLEAVVVKIRMTFSFARAIIIFRIAAKVIVIHLNPKAK